jgi:hypothetical protein
MKRNSRISGSHVLATTLVIGFLLITTAQAQTALTAFAGRFTLTNQVLWGKTALQPGNYTISIGASSMPTIALISDSKGRPVAQFISGIDSGKTSASNALLIKEKGGLLYVYSLTLVSLGRELVYDPALAREAVLEARAPQTVPVILAKR